MRQRPSGKEKTRSAHSSLPGGVVTAKRDVCLRLVLPGASESVQDTSV